MVNARASAVVFRPAADVWDFMTAVENIPVWTPSAQECESLTDGPLDFGTQFMGHSRFLGRRIDWVCEFVVVDRPHRLVLHSVKAPIDFEAVVDFVNVGAHTRITMSMEFGLGYGRFFGLADAVVARAHSRRLWSSLRGVSDMLGRDGASGLTKRQMEVLDLLEDGLSDAEIAAKLSISRKTASNHVAAILSALGVPTRHYLFRPLAPD